MLFKLQKHRESTLTFIALGMQQCCDATAPKCLHNMDTISNSIATVMCEAQTYNLTYQPSSVNLQNISIILYSHHQNYVLCNIAYMLTQMSNMVVTHHTLTRLHQVAITHCMHHMHSYSNTYLRRRNRIIQESRKLHSSSNQWIKLAHQERYFISQDQSQGRAGFWQI